MMLTVFFVVNCSNSGSGDSSSSSDSTGTTPASTPTTVAAIQLSSSSATIGTNQTATITVTLFDSSGALVSDSTEVVFSLNNPTLGSIPSPITTSSGYISQVFTARSTEGSVTITATAGSVSAVLTIQISDATAAATVAVTANPSSVTFAGTSVVSATVTDSLGNPMADGTAVSFTVDNTSIGTVVGSSKTSGGNGVAQSTFSAGSTDAGTATITATSGSASGTATITVTTAAAGSIEFYSATPQVVVIRGAGGQETSEIKFLVKDSNGNPVGTSETVNMVLSGPNGGEYLGSIAGTTTLDVGTVEGYATVILHSGTIPGTATITATVVGSSPVLSTSSGVIAIGGGMPSAGHFSLSAAALNIEGGAYDNIKDEILVLLADRYGNYNVLEGTAVSFYSECGAIDRAVSVDAMGQGTVTFRTQTPSPLDVVPDPLGTITGSCGAYCDDENSFISDFNATFGVDITADANGNNPRDGLCAIIAVVDGEEEFTDANANGVYDLGETYVDTYDDIHLEKDDDPYDVAFGTEVAGMPYDSVSEDLIVDRDGSGTFDGMNNAWDSIKRISKRINLLYTGEPTITLSDNVVSVANGGSQTIYFAIHDANYNRPIGDSTVAVTFTGGAATLTGYTSWTFLDSNVLGTPILAVTLTDSDPALVAAVAELKFTWTWKGNSFAWSIGGTTN